MRALGVPQAGQNLSEASTGQPQLGQGVPLGAVACVSITSWGEATAVGAAGDMLILAKRTV